MCQYSRLIVLIMLITLTLTPALVFAFGARCSDCGGAAHHDPNDCVKYAHASDCSCSECVEKRESSSNSGGGSSLWNAAKSFVGLLKEAPVINVVIAVGETIFNPAVNREMGETTRNSGGYMGNTYNGVAEQSQ